MNWHGCFTRRKYFENVLTRTSDGLSDISDSCKIRLYLKRYGMDKLKSSIGVLNDLRGELDGIYRNVNNNVIKGINSFFHAKGDGSFIVHTPKLEKREEDDGLNAYLPKEKFIPLIDVLRQIDRLAIFGVKFYHHTRAHDRKRKILYGRNLNI